MDSRVSVAILAAGLGTRMKSKHAKVLHEAGGVSLIEHVARAVLAVARPEDVVAVVGHQADRVKSAVAGFGIGFVEQTEQKGTGHAVEVCRQALAERDGVVLVVYGDCPLLRPETLQALVARQAESVTAATVITAKVDDPTGYGRILRDQQGYVRAIVEQKAASAEQLAVREINSGIYCINARLLWRHVGDLAPNAASGEIYLTDLVEMFVQHGYRAGAMLLDDAREILGINTRVELAEVDRIFRERKARQLMLDGVTIEKPETAAIDMRVEIGPDTVVEPLVRIGGNTRIGQDCRIGTGAIIRDSVIEDGAVIEPYTFVGSSHVEAGAVVGPFARLRMENRVRAGAHVGNFVELKKTDLGAGAKAMHLAYLGDSEIGDEVNIGAGTITCNYDGRRKHKTRIGRRAFVGSNATLVAPVEIGDGSYVAAGSVITEKVPEDTLALGRARQINKPGWPSRRRAEADS